MYMYPPFSFTSGVLGNISAGTMNDVGTWEDIKRVALGLFDTSQRALPFASSTDVRLHSL